MSSKTKPDEGRRHLSDTTGLEKKQAPSLGKAFGNRGRETEIRREKGSRGFQGVISFYVERYKRQRLANVLQYPR